MGKLLSLLARDNTSDCCGPKSNYDIFLDFENAQPNADNASELEVYAIVNEVLVQSDKILEEIQVYKVSRSIAILPPGSVMIVGRKPRMTHNKPMCDDR